MGGAHLDAGYHCFLLVTERLLGLIDVADPSLNQDFASGGSRNTMSLGRIGLADYCLALSNAAGKNMVFQLGNRLMACSESSPDK